MISTDRKGNSTLVFQTNSTTVKLDNKLSMAEKLEKWKERKSLSNIALAQRPNHSDLVTDLSARKSPTISHLHTNPSKLSPNVMPPVASSSRRQTTSFLSSTTSLLSAEKQNQDPNTENHHQNSNLTLNSMTISSSPMKSMNSMNSNSPLKTSGSPALKKLVSSSPPLPQRQEYESLNNKFKENTILLKQQQEEIAKITAANQQTMELYLMAKEEIQMLNFVNSLQEIKIGELEDSISQDRMNHMESSGNKTRKHKSEIQKLQKEKTEYEERANGMILEMNEQMTKLQTMAMSRIEALEKELMEQRHLAQKLQEENEILRNYATMTSTKSFTSPLKNTTQISQELCINAVSQSSPVTFHFDNETGDMIMNFSPSPPSSRFGASNSKMKSRPSGKKYRRCSSIFTMNPMSPSEFPNKVKTDDDELSRHWKSLHTMNEDNQETNTDKENVALEDDDDDSEDTVVHEDENNFDELQDLDILDSLANE